MSKDHFIPQFFLNNWADNNGTIGSYHYIKAIDEFWWSRKTSAQICYQKNLYGPSEKKYFEPLDNDAANLISKFSKINNDVKTEVALTENEGIKWSHFLLSMVIRKPQNVEKLAKAFEIHGLDKFESVAQIPAIINDGRAIKDLKSMKWVFAEVPSKFELITSDNPLIISLSMPLDSSSKIILPISPTHCFIACRDEAGRKLPKNPDDFVRYINSTIVKECNERIFTKSKLPLSFVEKNWTKT